MKINDLNELINKEISVDNLFYELIKLDWKYDLEESDSFICLSKTFWKEGFKVSLVLKTFCCLPPQRETSYIRQYRFYSFDSKKYPNRDIQTVFKDEQNDGYHTEMNFDEYIEYLNEQYPLYIPHADFNTKRNYYDKDTVSVQEINMADLPKHLMKVVIGDLKKVY